MAIGTILRRVCVKVFFKATNFSRCEKNLPQFVWLHRKNMRQDSHDPFVSGKTIACMQVPPKQKTNLTNERPDSFLSGSENRDNVGLIKGSLYVICLTYFSKHAAAVTATRPLT